VMVNADEDELVHLPKAWLEGLSEKEEISGLPDNLYSLPELQGKEKLADEVDGISERGQNKKRQK
jgi:hypothetical protein